MGQIPSMGGGWIFCGTTHCCPHLGTSLNTVADQSNVFNSTTLNGIVLSGNVDTVCLVPYLIQ